MTELKFNDIVESFEARWFMSVMSSGAVSILTNIIGSRLGLDFLKLIAGFLGYLAIFIFVIIFLIYSIRLIKFKEAIIRDLKHPIASNFFAGISISSAILTSMIINVLMKNSYISNSIGLNLSIIFYFFALFVGISLLIIVPFSLIISKEVDPKHAIGIWFLPPVGMFVVIFAGNFLALKGFLTSFIAHLNFILFGPAFILYFLTLSLVYYRIKFHPLPTPEVAPSFTIGLAPIGVSIIATQTFTSVVSELNEFIISPEILKEITNLYSVIIFGFGIWWFILTILILSYYYKNFKIPFSLGFWAFVFPVAAFGIGLYFLSMCPTFSFICPFIFFVWILASIIYLIVSYKTIIAIINKKVFIRPKSVK